VEDGDSQIGPNFLLLFAKFLVFAVSFFILIPQATLSNTISLAGIRRIRRWCFELRILYAFRLPNTKWEAKPAS
jgi:hypothetical protein